MKKHSIYLFVITITILGLTASKCEKEVVIDNPILGSLQPVSDGEIIEHTQYSLAYN